MTGAKTLFAGSLKNFFKRVARKNFIISKLEMKKHFPLSTADSSSSAEINLKNNLNKSVLSGRLPRKNTLKSPARPSALSTKKNLKNSARPSVLKKTSSVKKKLEFKKTKSMTSKNKKVMEVLKSSFELTHPVKNRLKVNSEIFNCFLTKKATPYLVARAVADGRLL